MLLQKELRSKPCLPKHLFPLFAKLTHGSWDVGCHNPTLVHQRFFSSCAEVLSIMYSTVCATSYVAGEISPSSTSFHITSWLPAWWPSGDTEEGSTGTPNVGKVHSRYSWQHIMLWRSLKEQHGFTPATAGRSLSQEKHEDGQRKDKQAQERTTWGITQQTPTRRQD